MVFLLALAFGLVKICGCYSLLVYCALKIFTSSRITFTTPTLFVVNPTIHWSHMFIIHSSRHFCSLILVIVVIIILFGLTNLSSCLSVSSPLHPPSYTYQSSSSVSIFGDSFSSYLVTFSFMSNFTSYSCTRFLFNVWWACPTIKLIIYIIRTFWKALSDWTVNSVAILS